MTHATRTLAYKSANTAGRANALRASLTGIPLAATKLDRTMYARHAGFIAGPPVTGEDFFGRKRQLSWLADRLTAGVSCLVVGQRRVGKSSLLLQVAYLRETSQLAGIDSYPIHVLLDSYGLDSPERFAGGLLRAIGRSLGSQPPAIAAELRGITGDEAASYLHVVDSLDRIRRRGLPLLLLLDEIDSAVGWSKGKVGAMLRSFISQGHLVVIGSSFRWPDELEQLDHGSPWFNIFDIRPIGLFSQEESLEMLQTLSGRSGNRFSEPECLFLVHVLGNHPFYLQAAGLKAFSDHSFADATGSCRSDVLKAVVAELPRALEFHLDYLFEHLDARELEALRQISRGRISRDDSVVGHLLRKGLIVEVDGEYQAASGMVRQCVMTLPKVKSGESVRDTMVGKLLAVGRSVFKIALEKAIEIASKTYLD